MRGHRILTLFAVEAAAMFALCAATSIPAASSASAASAGHFKAVSSMSVDRASNIGRLYEPGPDGGDVDGRDRDRDNRDNRDFRDDRERDGNRIRQQDDTAVRVKVRQHTKSNSRNRGGHEHYSPPTCFHCHHHHARPRVHRMPMQRPSLPVTGGNSTRMAVGGGAAVLTGAVLLWLSSVRRRQVPGSKSAAGAAA